MEQNKMNKYFKKACILLLLAFIAVPLSADDNAGTGSTGGEAVKVGAAGAQFLKLGVGARTAGMGGAGAAIVNDLTAIHWNPAGLADIKGMTVGFSHGNQLFDFNHEFAAGAMPLGEDFVFAASFVSYTTDRIPITTMAQSEGTGSKYTLSDMALGLSLSGYLTDQFSFGVTAKYVNNQIADLGASGFAFDIGTMYNTGISGIRLAFSIHNLGTKLAYSGQDMATTQSWIEYSQAAPLDAEYMTSNYEMPLIFRMGVGMEVFKFDDHALKAAVDFITFSDVEAQFAFGAEYVWNELLCLRGGYTLNHDQLGLGGGFGVNYVGPGFTGLVDFSIQDTKDWGMMTKLSLGFIID